MSYRPRPRRLYPERKDELWLDTSLNVYHNRKGCSGAKIPDFYGDLKSIGRSDPPPDAKPCRLCVKA